MDKLRDVVWAGTRASWEASVLALEKFENAQASGVNLQAGMEDDSIAGQPLYRVVGTTAVVEIKGPMVNEEIPPVWARFLGVTTYPNLQRQFAALIEDENIKSVVLDVNSGGGSKMGIVETADILRQLAAKKQVVTYASDLMCSAAYWLGSFGSRITLSRVGEVGSIGVIQIHMSVKEAFENGGYHPTVFRAGKFKSLGTPYEAMTPEAASSIQESLDFFYNQFVAEVAENRHVPFDIAKTEMAEGKVFFGEGARKAHLVDQIGTFESVLNQTFGYGNAILFNQSGSFAADHQRSISMSADTQNEVVTNTNCTQPVIGADCGEPQVNLDVLKGLEAKLQTSEVQIKELTVVRDSLSKDLAATKSDLSDYEALLTQNINAKAIALGTEVVIPKDMSGLKALNSQLEDKFQKKFPGGRVSAAVTEKGIEAGLPEWAQNLKG